MKEDEYPEFAKELLLGKKIVYACDTCKFYNNTCLIGIDIFKGKKISCEYNSLDTYRV